VGRFSRGWRRVGTPGHSIRSSSGLARHRHRREPLPCNISRLYGRLLAETLAQTGEEKKKLCNKLGAEVWIDFKENKDIISAIKSAVPDGLGPHAAIVTAA